MTKLVSDDTRKISFTIGTFLYVFGSRKRHSELAEVCLLVGCLTSQQQASDCDPFSQNGT